MTMDEVRVIAKQWNLKTANSNKADLIRSIQVANGNIGCFNTAAPANCLQTDCMWAVDCLWYSVCVNPC